MATANFTLTLPITVRKKAGLWISACPSLDVVSQGETEEEARKNLAEALRLFITTCYERGTLEAVMKECGFSIAPKPRRKESSRPARTITVPIPFRVKGTCGTECLA